MKLNQAGNANKSARSLEPALSLASGRLAPSNDGSDQLAGRPIKPVSVSVPASCWPLEMFPVCSGEMGNKLSVRRASTASRAHQLTDGNQSWPTKFR